LEHEILREALGVAPNRLYKDFRWHAVEGGQGFIEQDPVAAQDEDRLRDALGRDDVGLALIVDGLLPLAAFTAPVSATIRTFT